MVLEVGVGDGRMPRVLMGECTARFIGLDITERCREAPCASAVGDARRLPFRDGLFDVVYSLGVIEHFRGTELALREHVRVLKPKGTMFFTTPHLSIATLYKYFEFYWRRQYRAGTFESVRGRNLTIRRVRRLLDGLPVDLLQLDTCGVRPAESRPKRIMKKLIPGALQETHLFCIARKR